MSRSRIASAVAALVLSFAATLTACGGTNTSESDSTGSGDESGQDAKAATQYNRLTKAQLERVLLTIDDLPPGYSADPKGESSGGSNYCGSAPPKSPARSKARQDFTKGGGLGSELASVSVVQYRSPAAASRHFKRLRTGLKTCKGETAAGENVTYALMSTPKTGHPTLGVRVTAADFTVVINIAQVGPSLVNSGSGGLTNTDADLAASLIKQQVVKYHAAATG